MIGVHPRCAGYAPTESEDEIETDPIKRLFLQGTTAVPDCFLQHGSAGIKHEHHKWRLLAGVVESGSGTIYSFSIIFAQHPPKTGLQPDHVFEHVCALQHSWVDVCA